MTLAAGVDVGNSTTEVVLGRLTGEGIEVVGAGRAPTRRAKGSPESLAGAAELVRRLERQHGVASELAVVAPLRPVESVTARLPEPAQATGRLRVVGAGARTTAGRGFGVGRPHLLDGTRPSGGPVVALVPAGTGFRAALPWLERLVSDGQLAAVLLEDDEAVLVANRLSVDVPVIDEVAGAAVLGAALVAVEVSAPGEVLGRLTDPLRLVAVLQLAAGERGDAARVAGRLRDVSNAVVALDPIGPCAATSGQPGEPGGWVELDDGRGVERVPLLTGHRRVRAGRVGLARGYALPPGELRRAVDDLWSVDLSEVADVVLARSAATASRSMGLAALDSDRPYADPSEGLGRLLGIPARAMASEAAAARAGALSTPGAGDALVIDLGGGTLDAVHAAGAVVAAGAGELLTASVAALTGGTAAAAEWVKRGPAYRVDAPQVLLGEDGSRTFLDRPAPAETVGSLVAPGPAGLLAFHRTMAPGEWRALRLRLKVDLVGGNVARLIRTAGLDPHTVVLVGGPVADDEIHAAVSRALPAGVLVGRGDVAGSLGHRWAVAYGLLVLAGVPATRGWPASPLGADAAEPPGHDRRPPSCEGSWACGR